MLREWFQQELSLEEIKEIKSIFLEMEIGDIHEGCVYLIQADACYQLPCREETLTGEHVHIHAAGNMPLLRRTDQDSTCLYMRMREEHIYLTLRIYA